MLIPSMRAFLSSPFLGVRGLVLAFRHIFESSEFGDAKHSRTEDDLQLDPAPCPLLSMVLGCLVLWDVGLILVLSTTFYPCRRLEADT